MKRKTTKKKFAPNRSFVEQAMDEFLKKGGKIKQITVPKEVNFQRLSLFDSLDFLGDKFQAV